MSDISDKRNAFVAEVEAIISEGMVQAYASVEQMALLTFWKVGRRISEEIKRGDSRADYGQRVISVLAERLSGLHGGHYSKRNLDYYCQFYRAFPDFEIVNARVHNLRWTHYRALPSVAGDDARYW